MARPRVFISSTFYDLKHIRASLDIFVRSLGFDTVLSEKGDIAYTHDKALDESCYREVESCDLFVMIIGGRYGSPVSDSRLRIADGPDDVEGYEALSRYESITKTEYQHAMDRDLPIYVLIEKAVHAEYRTFKLNRENSNVHYAHVDSPQVFSLIEDILQRPRNNPVQTFERFTEIEEWLREQWAGYFRDLLQRSSQQQQFRALSEQVAEMRELNETLRRYMEAVMESVAKDRSVTLIDAEHKRLEDSRLLREATQNAAVRYVSDRLDLDEPSVVKALQAAVTYEDFVDDLRSAIADPAGASTLQYPPESMLAALNEARGLFGLSPLSLPQDKPHVKGVRGRVRPVK